MRLGSGSRRAVLFVLLGLALAATKWVDGEPQMPSAAAARETPRPVRDPAPGARAPDEEAAPALDLSRLRRDPAPVRADPFGARNWDPPPPKMPARAVRSENVEAPPPPPPQAPPLPFTYVGMLDEGDRVTVFLANANQDLAVKSGDVIDGVYRVDEVTSQRVVVTYLPLGQQQSLSIGSP
ncbi:MAG: hypothetical protein U1F52_01955 [Burkholderiales bacterium]